MRFFTIGLVIVLLLVPGCAGRRATPPARGCADIATTGQLNILTLNVLFDAPAAVRARSWTDIARFAATNNVHVVLLQEAVMTDVEQIEQLLGTGDSARDLQRVLNPISLMLFLQATTPQSAEKSKGVRPIITWRVREPDKDGEPTARFLLNSIGTRRCAGWRF